MAVALLLTTLLFLCGTLGSQQPTTIDVCDLSAVAGLRLMITTDVLPLFERHNCTIRADSFFDRALHLFPNVPTIDSKLITEHNTHSCPLCGKNFQTREYLVIHVSFRHLHKPSLFLKCPADLCAYFPCHRYLRRDSQDSLLLQKRDTACEHGREQEYAAYCAHYLHDAVNLSQPNATQLVSELTKTFCTTAALRCDEGREKRLYEAAHDTGKSALVVMFSTVGGLLVFIYYVVICFVYSDQQEARAKRRKKAK